MRLVPKYILREHVGPLLFALTTLTSLLLLNFIAKRFGDLVGKGLDWSVIGEFFLLSVPFTVAMTLPMATLIATLYAFSRLAAESEITALQANGVGLGRLLTPVLGAAAGLALLMLLFNDQVLPRANHRLSVLQGEIARKKPTFALRSQVMNEVIPRRFYLRAGRIDGATNALREVSIYDLGDFLKQRTIHADSGTLAMAPNGRDLQLTLYDGAVLESKRGAPDELQRSFFAVNHVRVRDVANALERRRPGEGTLKGDRELTICEMRQRVDSTARTRDSLVGLVRSVDPRVADTLPRTAGEPWSRAYCDAVAAVLPRAAGAQGAPEASPTPADTPTVAPSAGAAAPIAFSLATEADLHQRRIDQLRVEIHKKFALSFACIVFALLGPPIALRFPRGGVGLVIGASLAVFAIYYVGLIAGEELADRAILSPFWAMWAANLVLLAVGLGLASRMGREGVTARGGDLAEWWEGVRRRLRRRGATA